MGKQALVSRESAIPLYYQLESVLRQRIADGEFRGDQPLPGEEALAVEYMVSRITVRQALAALVRDGLVVRIRGKGTFVSKKSTGIAAARFTGLIEDLVTIGVKTAVQILRMEMVRPGNAMRDLFGLGEDQSILKIEKVRLAQKEPFSLVTNYLPPDIGRRIMDLDLTKRPLLTILEDDLGIETREASQTIAAVSASVNTAELLNIRVGDPLLQVERTVYGRAKKPVEHVSVLYRADRYSFSVRLKRGKSGPLWVAESRDKP
jgi:GntR family transcriptional regulator